MRERDEAAANVPAQVEAPPGDTTGGAVVEAGGDDDDIGFLAASHGLTGTQKMAVLLIALGPERSKTILSHFSDEQIERIAKEIARMRFVQPDQREAVLREAYEYIFGEEAGSQSRLMGGRAAAKNILDRAVGGVRARNILDRLDIPQTERFDFVGDNDLENLGYFLENQLPQIAAVTLLHLRPEHAHRVLEMFPPKFKAEIVSRMVHIDKVDRRMVVMLRDTLENHLQLSRDLVNLHGEVGATDLLKQIPAASQVEVLTAIGETDAELRAEIEKGLVTFDDLDEIDDREFAQLINRVRATDRELWPLALKSCSETMRGKIFNNMTSTVREEVEYRLETMQRRRLSEVEEAQVNIVKVAMQMADEGVLVFGGTEPLV